MEWCFPNRENDHETILNQPGLDFNRNGINKLRAALEEVGERAQGALSPFEKPWHKCTSPYGWSRSYSLARSNLPQDATTVQVPPVPSLSHGANPTFTILACPSPYQLIIQNSAQLALLPKVLPDPSLVPHSLFYILNILLSLHRSHYIAIISVHVLLALTILEK